MLECTHSFAHTNDVKIVRSRVAGCNTEESESFQKIEVYVKVIHNFQI